MLAEWGNEGYAAKWLIWGKGYGTEWDNKARKITEILLWSRLKFFGLRPNWAS